MLVPQADSGALLLRRRMEEDRATAATTHRQPWDNTTWRYVPPALKGVQAVTPEPWAKDGQRYATNMVEAREVDAADSPPRHISMIERAMLGFRHDASVSKVVDGAMVDAKGWGAVRQLRGTASTASDGSFGTSSGLRASRGKRAPASPGGTPAAGGSDGSGGFSLSSVVQAAKEQRKQHGRCRTSRF